MSTQGLERTFVEAIEINVCPALLETRAGLQYLQPRYFVVGELGQPVVKTFVVDSGGALGGVASTWSCLDGSKLLGETPVL